MKRDDEPSWPEVAEDVVTGWLFLAGLWLAIIVLCVLVEWALGG